MKGWVIVLAMITASDAVGQELYARAVQDEQKNLRIVTTSGREILLLRERDAFDFNQTSFEHVRISADRQTVGWLEYFQNCCTSYPIPRRLGIYRGGKRQVLADGRPISAWTFIGRGAEIAYLLEALHGPSNWAYGLIEVRTGRNIASYVPPNDANADSSSKPAWVRSLDAVRRQERR